MRRTSVLNHYQPNISTFLTGGGGRGVAKTLQNSQKIMHGTHQFRQLVHLEAKHSTVILKKG